MYRILIIAYGNPLRSDDGVAWRAAEALRKKLPPEEIEILSLHQLGPELAESASRSEFVIFVDAAAGKNPGEIEIEELTGTPESAKAPAFAHALNPEAIVTLAAQLYHTRPRAYAATISGETFDHGESVSPVIEAALSDFISRIEILVRLLLSKS